MGAVLYSFAALAAWRLGVFVARKRVGFYAGFRFRRVLEFFAAALYFALKKIVSDRFS